MSISSQYFFKVLFIYLSIYSFIHSFASLFIQRGLVFYLYACLCVSVGSTGTAVTDSCELPRGCWELNTCPLEEQTALLTAEPSPAPLLGTVNGFVVFSLMAEL